MAVWLLLPDGLVGVDVRDRKVMEATTGRRTDIFALLADVGAVVLDLTLSHTACYVTL